MNLSNGRVPWAWVAVGLIVLTVPTLARAHAQLVRSTPAIRGVLTAAPDRVQLWFNENLEPAFARVSVWSAGGGVQVDRGDAAVAWDDPKQLSVGLKPLTPGHYTVKYRVLSVDGHVVEREFPFTLRAP
jgi:methionine-rich copper-binding protein CopC